MHNKRIELMNVDMQIQQRRWEFHISHARPTLFLNDAIDRRLEKRARWHCTRPALWVLLSMSCSSLIRTCSASLLTSFTISCRANVLSATVKLQLLSFIERDATCSPATTSANCNQSCQENTSTFEQNRDYKNEVLRLQRDKIWWTKFDNEDLCSFDM